MLQPIEIFKPGRHTAASGSVLAITATELADAARVYNPALHRAPLVVGHPKTDDVAYGHVASLDYSDSRKRLIAGPADVEPQFADLVADGRLLAVSASFYTPTSPNNPVPGSYYLRHVGFLGAEAPAVKGLKRPAVDFSEAEEGVIEFGDWADTENAGLWRQMREWLIGKFGLDEADKAVPGYRVESLSYAAAQPEAEATGTKPLSYSEGDTVSNTTDAAALAAQAAELAARSAELDARDADLAKRQREAQHAARLVEFREFTGKLVTEGRLLPVQQGRLVAVMGALPEAQVLDFAEGDATVQKPALQAMQEFLQALPKIVDFTERAAPEAGDAAADTVDFNDSRSIARAAEEYREAESKAGRTVGVAQAVQHVMSTKPD